MLNAVKNNLPRIRELFRKYHAERVYLFGSAATDDYSAESDVDFLFSFPEEMDYKDYAENYFNLLHELRNILNREVDLVAEKTVKNPYLRQRIDQHKIQLL